MKRFVIQLAKAAIILFSVLVLVLAAAMTWLWIELERARLAIYKGFNDDEIREVIDSKKMVRLYGAKYGSAAAPADFIKGAGIAKVCLEQPYGLPSERLSLNGLEEPNDGISYLSFVVADGEHYYAVPLNHEFHVPMRGCRDPGSILVSYQCTARQSLRYCLKWKDAE